MAVTVVPGSVKIHVWDYPVALTPQAPLTRDPLTGQAPPAPVLAGFFSKQITLGGEALLNGDPEEVLRCTAGFVQVEWIETFWCYYRGKTYSDGSMLVQRGRPPARPRQSCRDCNDPKRSTLWYDVDGLNRPADDIKDPPFRIGGGMDDSPGASVMLGQLNTLTGKTNLLREVQIERHFCAVFTLQTGDGFFHHLASRYWNLRWQAIFHAHDFDNPFKTKWDVTLVKGGNGQAVSPTILGTPTDHRFAQMLTAPGAPICGDYIKNAALIVDNFLWNGQPNPYFDPRTRREGRVWENFDVRR